MVFHLIIDNFESYDPNTKMTHYPKRLFVLLCKHFSGRRSSSMAKYYTTKKFGKLTKMILYKKRFLKFRLFLEFLLF